MDKRALKESQLISQFNNKHAFDPKIYEEISTYTPWREGDNILSIHTTNDLVRFLKSPLGKSSEISARVFAANKKERSLVMGKIQNKEKFLEAIKKNRMKEDTDCFAYDFDGELGGKIGDDYTPLIGGPFAKQLYLTDYLKMHQNCFYAFGNDPVARRIVSIIRGFTLGKGFRTDCKDKAALALWRAFERANKFSQMLVNFATEISIYGETMSRWLPGRDINFSYTGESKKGLIPRLQLLDPSSVWEIVTVPEDISDVLFYQQIYPTQYQIFTDGKQPSARFIYQQVPAKEVHHYKINCVSNEKRGRSDYYPALGYMKRLRDAVNYNLISQMKNSAWSIDTTIDGGKADMDKYADSQKALGTIPAAGGEFIHSKKVERKYLGNDTSGAHGEPAIFSWALSMACIAGGIPQSYFGTHISGGQTRASAVVSTEPIVKFIEERRDVYERFVLDISRDLFDQFGFKDSELEITFPEIITQDRSAKMKDTALAEQQGWISKRRAAEIGSKELGITDYDYDDEQSVIIEEKALGQGDEPMTNPLPPIPGNAGQPTAPQSKLSSQDKKNVNDAR